MIRVFIRCQKICSESRQCRELLQVFSGIILIGHTTQHFDKKRVLIVFSNIFISKSYNCVSNMQLLNELFLLAPSTVEFLNYVNPLRLYKD